MASTNLRRIAPRKKLAREVLAQLVDLINGGSLKPGARLPSETDLAAALGVSRPSVREALRSLELLGAIECRRGSGNYVADRTGEAWSEAIIGELLVVGSPFEVLQARTYLEAGTAELCATERTDDDLEALRDCLERFEAKINAKRDAKSDGLEFHQLVARGSHNAVLAMALDLIIERMRKRVWRYYEHALCADEHHVLEHLDQHRRLLRAIEEGDPKGAVREMADHLQCLAADLRGGSETSSDAEVPEARKGVYMQ